MSIRFPSIAAAVLALAACTEQPAFVDASRVDNTALYFHNDAVEHGPVIDQAAQLTAAAEALVRRSRTSGALIGAAVGCGVTVATGSNVQNCVTRAAVGAATGAIIGDTIGEREVTRRVELVAEGEIARDLNRATRQMRQLQADLPTFLSSQEAELNQLTLQFAQGSITRAEHDAGVERIVAERAELIRMLELSARDASRTADNLRRAQDRGQEGLDWHIEAATNLADQVISTRSSFSML